ncbi:MAG: hypothetical protein HY898_22560 [Deltaproteobacteria bacterium]|nr:hypothetical protein [Deltaproteobacteria bacterium]
MRLPFLDRTEERSRLAKMLSQKDGALAVVYGRRRCGKSRLILEAIGSRKAVYFSGDDRESTVQRSALAREIARVLPGFDQPCSSGGGARRRAVRFWRSTSSLRLFRRQPRCPAYCNDTWIARPATRRT